MEEFTSTAFESVSYDPAERTLDVTYADGSRRRYYDVPPDKARRLQQLTPSPGRYYNKSIRGIYDTRKLP